MRPLIGSIILVFPAISLFACASSSPESADSKREPDAIGENENPALAIPGASSTLADNIVTADVGGTFGTDDAHIPYPDTYWPFVNEGIDAQWQSAPSALEKYMTLADPTHVESAKQWEHTNHGSAVPDVQSWWGHCPGWTGAAMDTAPMTQAVYAKSDGQGNVVSCGASDPGCVRFEIGDVNALAAEVYVDGQSRFIGARCDTAANAIQRDTDGRIVRSGNGCHGLNPGALLIVLSQQMKRLHKALAIDAQNDFNTDQIWNQPAYRYRVNRYDNTLTMTQAANLVAHDQEAGDRTTYPWNAAAQGFALVDISISWVSEMGPNLSPVSGAETTRETRFVAVIELDAPATDPVARIIGGEYLDDPNSGADRLTVPPFVWIIQGPGPEYLAPTVGGGNHNPYVKPSKVQALLALNGSQSTTPAPSIADACSAATDCGACTALAACGWCDGACRTGVSSGPTAGACTATAWSWTSNSCGAP